MPFLGDMLVPWRVYTSVEVDVKKLNSRELTQVLISSLNGSSINLATSIRLLYPSGRRTYDVALVIVPESHGKHQLNITNIM